MWLVSLGILVFQRDLGSSLLFFGLFLVMLYVATERPGWLVVGGVLFLGGAVVSYQFLAHVQNRVNIWLDPMKYFDQTPGSGQLVESLFGMAWGGLIGRGFGGGSPERVPFAESDFIIGAIGEELGLTGVIAVILCYGLIVERALRAALICRDGFGKLMATGLAAVFALQVFVVIGGVTRLIPLTGLTTPFLSYGGSSLVANWVMVALLAAHLRPGPPAGARPVRRRGQGRRPGHPGHQDGRYALVTSPPLMACCAPPHGRCAALPSLDDGPTAPSLRRLAQHPVDATLATAPEGATSR